MDERYSAESFDVYERVEKVTRHRPTIDATTRQAFGIVETSEFLIVKRSEIAAAVEEAIRDAQRLARLKERALVASCKARVVGSSVLLIDGNGCTICDIAIEKAAYAAEGQQPS